ncbi:MAG: phycobilisome rod-core linker polypeptide [Synechococcus sp. BS301-5m-G54]|nr:phycobilisome rod-core linker polypeptide [Synechococcus sp. BS301-5m-G54]MBL6796217.1 phycobilisome rod-core linker polypeptide [Synechococcus sp. BS307-5m-G34]
MPAIKLKRDFTDQNRVSFAVSNSRDAAKSAASNRGKASKSTAEYKENQCGSMGIGAGPRIHEICPFSSVNHSYAATGDGALNSAISAAYKQVFGNIGIANNQRLSSLEAFLRDGRITTRDFMAGLVKSDIYKEKFFFAVSPMRGVELTTKHLLGRPPISQEEVGSAIKLIADHGFDAFVDQLVRSEEYLETFGTDTVPYLRGFKSEARSYCSTFVNMVEISPANASADHVMYSGPLLVKRLTKGRSALSAAASGFVADTTEFSYTNAVNNPRNAAFRRMYAGKFDYRLY